MRQVAVTGLHKAFGAHPVLTGVDLEVPAGSLTAILGPSGSGKTTLLRLMAGFERLDAGTIGIGDVLVDGPSAYVAPERRRIGYVPQEGTLFPHLTVAGNVGFGLTARERRGGKVDAMLETVGLGGFGRRYPHQLSGGQQQRVALARALAIEPAVVLLDEPFASLDASLRAGLRADVQEIFRRAGTTAVLVTHDQDEALSTADRVAVLRDGKIAQCAPPEDLYRRPADAGLASFIGDANLLEGILAERRREDDARPPAAGPRRDHPGDRGPGNGPGPAGTDRPWAERGWPHRPGHLLPLPRPRRGPVRPARERRRSPADRGADHRRAPSPGRLGGHAPGPRPGLRVASRLTRGDCEVVPQLTGLPCCPATT